MIYPHWPRQDSRSDRAERERHPTPAEGNTTSERLIIAGEADREPVERLFFEPPAYFDHLIAGIDAARETVAFETYIFEKDALGDRIAEHLIGAERRGVAVRVSLDGIGTPHWTLTYASTFMAAGIETRIFNPPPWWRPVRRGFGWKALGKLWTAALALNERNHRKMCIVDGCRAWVGGMNVCAGHLHWRDTGIYVEGDRPAALHKSFDEVWSRATVVGRKRRRGRLWRRLSARRAVRRLVRLNADRRARRRVYSELLRRLHAASRRIWITTAYFVPPGKLLRALTSAAARGVDVRVLVPRWPDIAFMGWVSAALYRGLLRAGVRLYEYHRSPLHAKTMLIDDWGVVGSCNLNHRSLLHDLEVEIVLATSGARQALAEQFLTDLEGAETVTLAQWRSRPLAQRMLGNVLLAARYWM